MNEKIEYKFMQDVKADSETDGKMRFSGYLAYFDNVDAYGDVIIQGAFKNTLREARRKNRTIPVLEQHGGFLVNTDNTPIGYYAELEEDDKGLKAEGVLFNTSRGKDMYTTLKEAPTGAMGQSIGFSIVKSRIPEQSETRKTGVYRYLEEVKLWEGSIVTFPANDKARVDDVKAASLFWRQLETHFKKNGFSGEDAKKAISLIKSGIPNAVFAQFLQKYGNFDLEGQKDAGLKIEGSEKLLEVLERAKVKADCESFKNLLDSFSLK